MAKQKSWSKSVKIVAVRFVHRLVELIAHALFSLVYGGPGQKLPPIDNLLLLDSASTLALKIRTRKVTSVEVVKAFITRIEKINPILNCVVDNRFEAALQDAKEVDELLESGSKTEQEIAEETPFLGVPFTTKDCFEVKDLCFTSGLQARKHIKGVRDADAIATMRHAGAIMLAITNVAECCMWWESNNTVFGRSNNPYNTNHIVGGSSGGEACLLAAAGSPIGVGSDIGGSIRMPAYFNGIFGHKPSPGIVSNEGQYPMALSKDQETFLAVGPMSRFATDLVPALKLMAGRNASKLKLDAKVEVSKLKFYYMEDDGGALLLSPVDPEIKAAMRRCILHLDRVHGIKAKRVSLERLQKQTPIWFARMKVDKSVPTFAAMLTNRQYEINSWWELAKCFVGMSNYTLVGILTTLLDRFGIHYGSKTHAYFSDESKKLQQEFKDMLGNDGIFLYPTHPQPAPYHVEPLFKFFNFSYTGIFNIIGLPVTAVPLGLHSKGLPIGIQVVGGPNQDSHCLAVAVELEKAFGGWVPPSISV